MHINIKSIKANSEFYSQGNTYITNMMTNKISSAMSFENKSMQKKATTSKLGFIHTQKKEITIANSKFDPFSCS